ncbi:hypothetical protein FACS1894132_11380 [Clostridia bacterium]|nr:hypothetical protein FACS1894132_11380 [Clostridia bacterium]
MSFTPNLIEYMTKNTLKGVDKIGSINILGSNPCLGVGCRISHRRVG